MGMSFSIRTTVVADFLNRQWQGNPTRSVALRTYCLAVISFHFSLLLLEPIDYEAFRYVSFGKFYLHLVTAQNPNLVLAQSATELYSDSVAIV